MRHDVRHVRSSSPCHLIALQMSNSRFDCACRIACDLHSLRVHCRVALCGMLTLRAFSLSFLPMSSTSSCAHCFHSGPFALPAAKKGNRVLANDLNPKSYEYLVANIRLNKLESKVEPLNMDGRAFWRDHVRRLQRAGALGRVHHVIMNLPAIALEFLDAFCGSYTQAEIDELGGAECLPRIHCYCFSGAPDLEADVRQRAARVLGSEPAECSVFFVRLVSPKKSMMRISFRLPMHAAVHESPLAEQHRAAAAMAAAAVCAGERSVAAWHDDEVDADVEAPPDSASEEARVGDKRKAEASASNDNKCRSVDL